MARQSLLESLTIKSSVDLVKWLLEAGFMVPASIPRNIDAELRRPLSSGEYGLQQTTYCLMLLPPDVSGNRIARGERWPLLDASPVQIEAERVPQCE
jgi:hypothetical protein